MTTYERLVRAGFTHHEILKMFRDGRNTWIASHLGIHHNTVAGLRLRLKAPIHERGGGAERSDERAEFERRWGERRAALPGPAGVNAE